MAHKTLVNGTSCDVQGGKCLVGGTAYDILKGRTLIGGTGYDIGFKAAMPVKGDLITMNLDGSDRLYRVLKVVDETTFEVLTMWDLTTRQVFNDEDDYSYYVDRNLDNYLNSTWWYSLSYASRRAIAPKHVTQYKYQYSNSVFNADTHPAYADFSSKKSKSSVGDRNVYALDIEDILEYFDNGTFSTADICTMFWNTATAPANAADIWLRSSDYNEAVWLVTGYRGVIDRGYIADRHAVRAAFQINLAEIDFTIN